MAYDKMHKLTRRNDRNAKAQQKKVFGFATSNSRDDEERPANKRYY